MDFPQDYKSYLKWKLAHNDDILSAFEGDSAADDWIVDNWSWLTDNDIIKNIHQIEGTILISFHIEGCYWHVTKRHLEAEGIHTKYPSEPFK